MSGNERGLVRSPETKHWLVRPKNIRLMWWIFLCVLAITVAVQALVEVHDHFEVDGLFGFNAAYGFLTCVAMVIVAKVLGWWLKRPDDYYPQEKLFLWMATPESSVQPDREEIDV
jgi:hypothetical protein